MKFLTGMYLVGNYSNDAQFLGRLEQKSLLCNYKTHSNDAQFL
ncbi:hypothetical protein Epro_1076 [Endomicrobium proavitum]|uniref:Uncharacterized protein n=1 Tax=Endomicrobium proavitum TaxID=1408281 RepID=A0A0G3WKR7_9BACT|nr:hypothetical protein Epro_1076 [Endomicrobium proavitum]